MAAKTSLDCAHYLRAQSTTRQLLAAGTARRTHWPLFPHSFCSLNLWLQKRRFAAVTLTAVEPARQQLAAGTARRTHWPLFPHSFCSLNLWLQKRRFAAVTLTAVEPARQQLAAGTARQTHWPLFSHGFYSLNQWLQKRRLIAPIIYGRNQRCGSYWQRALPACRVCGRATRFFR